MEILITQAKKQITVLITALCVLLANVVLAQEQPLEYPIKAAFLYKFAGFIEWPAEAGGRNSPFIMGVLGDELFANELEEIVKGRVIANRPIIVKRFSNLDEIKSAQILFVSRSEKKRAPQIVRELQGIPVLTVGESEDFLLAGGMINFYIEQNRVKFAINPDTAQQAGLKISSKLLSLAKLVKT